MKLNQIKTVQCILLIYSIDVHSVPTPAYITGTRREQLSPEIYLSSFFPRAAYASLAHGLNTVNSTGRTTIDTLKYF